MLEIRRGGPADSAALAGIFWSGVRDGAAPRYSADQRRAWLPERPSADRFADRLADQAIFVAERNGVAVGFMTLRADGYLDFAYVLPDERGQGTAAALLAVLENHAHISGLSRLTVRASDMARPFLARRGWQVTSDATVMRDGIALPSTHMVRDLSASPRAAAS
ncbi:MAG: GNAT family N-acetyltransferase [Pseudomonadota bacterium]